MNVSFLYNSQILHDFAEIYAFLIIRRAQWFHNTLRPLICIYVSIMGQLTYFIVNTFLITAFLFSPKFNSNRV